MDALRLRDVDAADIPAFFAHQRDAEACRMAAFTAEDPNDRASFIALWTGILANDRIVKRTIVLDELVVGNIVNFIQYGLPAVGYWIDRAYWGRGIATEALTAFLRIVIERPLYARTAYDNIGSQRVLEKCGFVSFERDRGYACARGREIEEVVFVLRG